MTDSEESPPPYRVPRESCAVYHLITGDEVVYVGQSTNVLRRIADWNTCRAIPFDGYRVFPCDESALNDLEAEHIARHRPRFNRAGNTRPFLPVVRFPEPRRRTPAETADWLESLTELTTGGQILYATEIATTVRHLVAMVEAGLFPAPVAQRNGGKWLYWNGRDVAAWIRARAANAA